MVMPSLIGADARLNAAAAGDQSGERVVRLSNGTALVYWQVAGSATPVQGRIVGVNGPASVGDLSFTGIASGATVAAAEMPGGGFVMVSRLGTAIHVEKYNSLGTSIASVDLVSSEAISGGPVVETTADGTIGIYVKTATQAQVGALDANLNLTVPFDTLVLNNGTSASAATDADGSVWTLIDGAGIATTGFGFVSTRGSGAATVIQLHVVNIASQSDVSGPITIASGAGVNVASFRLTEMANGNLLASWIDGTSVRGQIYSGAGAVVGAGMSVAASAPTGVAATGLADGGAMLLWSDTVGDTRDIRASVFSAAGAAASGVFTVNSDTAGAQTNPSAALLSNGEVLVAWDSANGSAIDVVDRVASFVRPDAVADAFTVAAGSTATLAVLANDSDPNGSTYSVQSVGAAANGTVTLASGIVTYTPKAGFTGADSFSYTLVDSSGLIDTTTVALTVTAPGGAPTAPLLRIDPADAGTGVSPVADIALLFNDSVERGSGTITLARADGTVVETFDAATSTRVSVNGNRVVINPGAALASAAGYTVAIAAGAFSIGGTAYAGLTGYDFTTAAASASVASQYQLSVTSGVAASVVGYGRVIGDTGVQDVTVVNLPGQIGFDASFNTGGDRIHLSGSASDYTVVRSGSSAVLTDGDTSVTIPVGTVGADIVFDDGVRTLSFDTGVGAVKIGTQAVTTTAATITAAAGAATATGAAGTTGAAQLALVSGAVATAIGNETVVGTSAGAETVSVASGAKIVFDASFNAGGDTIILPGFAGGYAAARSGSSVVLTSASESVTLPVGPVGATLRFADGDRTLLFDQTAATVKIGGQAIGTAATSLTATVQTIATLDRDNDNNPATSFTIDAAGGNYRFTDNGSVPQNVIVTGFGRGDSVVLQDDRSGYFFSGANGDITISHVNTDGVLSTTVFQGIANPAIFVNSEASAEAAAGFDFVTFTV